MRHPNSVPLVVIVSDGLPTVPLRRRADPVADLLAEGRAPRRARMGCVVAEVAGQPGGCAERLAAAAGGTRLPLSSLAGLLLDTVEDAS